MTNGEVSSDEFTRRGNEIFEDEVRPQLGPEHEPHEFVAIDIETGDYEVDASEVDAADRLLARRPEAQGRIWLRRVGSATAHRIGAQFQAP